ncbi:hypothetical protein AAC387_Pa07g3612 [Persea americana]
MESPVVDALYLEAIEKARRDLRALIYSKNCAPIMLRLSWHDSGTYDVSTKTGGPNGSIRNEEEYKQESNKGLKIAIDLCEEVKKKNPKITYADLYQDEEAFFKDYAESHKKLPELGLPHVPLALPAKRRQ